MFAEDILKTRTVLVGFDGYVDKILRPIKSSAGGVVEYFTTVSSFGEYLAGKKNTSCSVQLDLVNEQRGGNAPIMAETLASCGVQTSLIGMLGMPSIFPVFSQVNDKCHAWSFDNPWETFALEFVDGKVMLSPRIASLDNQLGKIEHALGGMEQASRLLQADLIALVNWGEIDFMHGLWQDLFYRYISPGKREKEKTVFFDLADISRHAPERIEEVLKLLTNFSAFRTVVLGLNRNEALVIGEKILGGVDELETIGMLLHQRYAIDQVVVHTAEQSVLCENSVVYHQKTKHITTPAISTGCGDNFNAGFCLGILLGVSPESKLEIANSVAHHYIKYGISVSHETPDFWQQFFPSEF